MTLLIYALIPVSTAIQRINIRLPMSRVSEIIFFFQLWIIQKQTSRTYIASLQYMCFLILPLIRQDYHFLTGYSIIPTIIMTKICEQERSIKFCITISASSLWPWDNQKIIFRLYFVESKGYLFVLSLFLARLPNYLPLKVDPNRR